MSSLVSIAMFRQHLNLAEDATGEDGYLAGLIAAATRTCELHLGRDLASDPELTAGDLAIVAQAVLLIGGAFYDNRDGATDMPAAAGAILRPLQNLAR